MYSMILYYTFDLPTEYYSIPSTGVCLLARNLQDIIAVIFLRVIIDNTRILWIGNAHKNFLTILITVRQSVSILFVLSPAAVFSSCSKFPAVKRCLGVSLVIEDCAGGDFLATHHK